MFSQSFFGRGRGRGGGGLRSLKKRYDVYQRIQCHIHRQNMMYIYVYAWMYNIYIYIEICHRNVYVIRKNHVLHRVALSLSLYLQEQCASKLFRAIIAETRLDSITPKRQPYVPTPRHTHIIPGDAFCFLLGQPPPPPHALNSGGPWINL